MAGRTAIISDIHSNLEALRAVLEDIDKRECSEIICLGDIVGYGPDPRACVKIAMKFSHNLLGNHEEAALFVPAWFNEKARRAVEWTREQLSGNEDDGIPSADLWNFLGDLKSTARRDDVLFVHGSPRKPTTEYIRTLDVRYDREKMDEIFSMVEHLCFVGHSHVPGVFTPNHRFLSPSKIGGAVRLGKDKAVINVGAVGQPRDGDPRACYATLESDVLRWHRVEYDIDMTAAKILRATGLPDGSGERLRRGM